MKTTYPECHHRQQGRGVAGRGKDRPVSRQYSTGQTGRQVTPVMWSHSLLPCLLLGILATTAQHFEEEEKPYRGQLVGQFSSYHHQVSGDVYAVDEDTLLLQNFVYDGNGKDTFFWAGSSNQPNSKGFIVPDKTGRTNVLDRYLNEEFTIKLPSQKRITDLKWFSVYDLTTQSNFGDIYVAEGFEPPGYQTLTDIPGTSNSVKSAPVVVMDSKTVKIPAFTYDGRGGKVYFTAGEGPQPSSKGFIVPDELGYLAPLGRYEDQDVILQLPGTQTIFNIDWIAVYNRETKHSLGHVIIPEGLNVPPSLVSIMPHTPDLDNCMMLHKNMMVAWDSFPPQLTIQLAGHIGNDEYMAFGLSGQQGIASMKGGDVVVAYMDEYLGHVEDYNLTARSVCHMVQGQQGGACNDLLLGGSNNYQLHTAKRENGVTVITYRTTFGNLADGGDLEIPEEGDVSVIWAIGKMAEKAGPRVKEPSFHHSYTRQHTTINFGRKEPMNTCFALTSDREEILTPWRIPPIWDAGKRTFNARLGPAGGKRGFSGLTGLPSSSLVWYVEGLMVPELYMRRGLPYTFKIEGGNNAGSAEYYHPFIITDEPVGGYNRLSDEQKSKIRVLAGVEYTGNHWRGASRRGVARPTNNGGRLCRWQHPTSGDRRRDDEFPTFERFRNNLELRCDEGEAALLEVVPNVTWPDTVYYHSYTTPYMGWKIRVVDSFRRRPSFGSATRPSALVALGLSLLVLSLY